MAQKTKTPTLKTTVTIDQFADRVHTLHTAVAHGDDPNAAAIKARNAWRSLDPIETVRGTAAHDRAVRLGVALGKAADITSQVPKKAAWSARNFRAGLLIDQADAILRSSAETDAATSIQTILGDIEVPANERPGKKVESAFDALSARAMLLHLESRKNAESKMDPWRKQGAEAILRASLGHLIKDSVTTLGDMQVDFRAAQARGSNGSHLSGRLVETMYFTYRLMGWYRSEGSLASGYPRFAVFREDKPLITPTPKRSFDVAVMSAKPDLEPELVQIKAGHDSRYAEGITVWTPNQQHGVAVFDETSQVMGWFNTLVDNERSDSDMAAAWRNLSLRFADPQQNA